MYSLNASVRRVSRSVPQGKNRRDSPSLAVIGYIFLGCGVFMIPCFATGLIHDNDLIFTLVPMILGLVIGLFCVSKYSVPDFIRPANAVALIGIIWVTIVIFGMIPYLLYGMSFTNSFFESVSGFTTTGATIIPDIKQIPISLLLWRNMTNWIGGIVIIIMVMLILPMVGAGSKSSISNEMSGSESQNVTVRVKDAAIEFAVVYMILSGAMFVCLILLGMNVFDSVCTVLTTISTGGFSSYVTEYTLPVKLVLILFMFMGGTNFYLHFRAIYYRQTKAYLHNTEFKIMVVWFAIASVLLFIVLGGAYGHTLEVFIESIFSIVSTATTTGIFITDYNSWPFLAIPVIIVVALIGASSSSTAGGTKVFRAYILFMYIRSTFRRILHPTSISYVTMSGAAISEEQSRSALIIIVMFVLTIIVSSILFMMHGMAPLDGISCVIGAVTNFGPALGEFGPMGSYAGMEEFLKVCMGLLMWIGRLEIATALVLLSPGLWKEQVKDYKDRRNQSRF